MTVINCKDYPDLPTAIGALPSGGVVVVDSDQLLTSNLTVPANVSLLMERAARLQASSSSISLTVNGEILTGRTRLFEGFGSGKVALSNQHTALPEWWGVRDGSGRDDIAINEAIKSCIRVGLVGDYFLGEKVLIPYGGVNGSRKQIVGLAGKARLYASTANKTLLHLADSFCVIKDVSLWANAQGVTLFKVTPELDNANTTVTNQNFNLIQNMDLNGGDYGLILMAGREIGATASGCWYNRFINMFWTSNGTSLWIKDNGSGSIVSSGSNSNTFVGEMNGSIGLGVRIDAGGGNQFYLQQENLSKGIQIADQMVNGGDNPNNTFYSMHQENVSVAAEINEPLTKFFNSDLDHTKVGGSAYEAFLDDGRARYKQVSLVPDGGGSISLNPSYNTISWMEKDGLVKASGYLHVASVSGSPIGVLHVPNALPKAPLPGTQFRAVGIAAVNELNTGSGASSSLCRILEGNLNPNGTLDIFGTSDGNLKYLAPYVKQDTNIQLSIEYAIR